MRNNEMKEYIQELIQKYDYYDPIHERIEALRFGNIKNKKILDIGAGKGYLAILAVKNFNCDVTTIDISKEKINLSKENAKKEGVLDKIHFKLADAIDIPFKKNRFYAAISFNALHHNKKGYKKMIEEMFRVAKDKVVITELNENGAKIFDEYIHPDENHKEMSIDLEELEKKLSQYGNVRKLNRKLMTTFVCKK
jgi:ubiquinone/menaquinone biosynthesis C-methylase UbiE